MEGETGRESKHEFLEGKGEVEGGRKRSAYRNQRLKETPRQM